MPDQNMKRTYRISIFPMLICFCILWIGVIGIFLALKYIKYSEAYEMTIIGFISFAIVTLFIKYIAKVVVSEEGIKGQGNDNKHYFVEWDKIERVKLTKFLNLKFIVLYFNMHTQSIYIPVFLSKKRSLFIRSYKPFQIVTF